MSNEILRPLVNCALLKRFQNKEVTIIGKVKSVGDDYFEIHTSDGKVVAVKMKEPLMSPLSGLVEVHGMSDGKSISCNRLIRHGGDEYDMSAYNSVITMTNSLSDLWNMS